LQVYKAVLGGVQTVAVKMLSGRQDPAAQAKFCREVAILRSCRCTFLCGSTTVPPIPFLRLPGRQPCAVLSSSIHALPSQVPVAGLLVACES